MDSALVLLSNQRVSLPLRRVFSMKGEKMTYIDKMGVCAVVMALAALTTTSAHARRAVPIKSVVDKIPVNCLNGLLSPATVEPISCNRADTREDATPVPDGYNLVITDIGVDASPIDQNGSFRLAIGRLDGVAVFPPGFTFSGEVPDNSTWAQTHPFIVLHSGEALGVRVDQRTGGAITLWKIHLTGFLIKEEDLSKAF